MANMRVKLIPPETFHQFLQLPLHDLMVPGISKYLKLKDIFNFRCCSLYCKELAESALADRRRIVIYGSRKLDSKASFRVITEHCRRLRKIELSFLYWLTDEMLIQLFNNNPLLKYVNIESCGGSLTPKALHPLANCKNFTKLHLLHCCCDDTFLEMLNKHEIQLEQVGLSYSQGFSEQGLCAFFRKQPRLKYIYLPRLESMFRQILETIAEFCQEMHCLSLKDYNKYDHEEDLKWFLKASPKLEVIYIGCFQDLSSSLLDLLYELNVLVEYLNE